MHLVVKYQYNIIVYIRTSACMFYNSFFNRGPMPPRPPSKVPMDIFTTLIMVGSYYELLIFKFN